MKSKVIFTQQLPSRENYPKDTVLIYDKNLDKYSAKFQKWSHKFSARIAVSAGESSKSLESFSGLVQNVLRLSADFSSRDMNLLVVGGGTITDLGGFLASVLKRGVKLILIPTTWLAAIDSAHGGKNGLNVAHYKNQIGTFYFPEKVEIIKEILFLQPSDRAQDVFGELVKIALISNSNLFTKLQNIKKIDNQIIYSALPLAIRAKNKIVSLDPHEKRKIRHILNLGHTFAHAMESCFDIPHGEAVLYGVVFSLIWSRADAVISDDNFERILQSSVWPLSFDSKIYQKLLAAPLPQVKKSILQDKKRSKNGFLLEPFISRPGQVVLKNISVNDFMNEFKRQKKVISRASYAEKY